MGDPILSDFFPGPAPPWVAVYRALVSVLQTDSTLSSMPIRWDVRVGAQNETQPPAPNEMPWVAVVPLDFDMATVTEIENTGRFRVRIDIAVKGTHWDDLGNFAGAVYGALARNKPTPSGVNVENVFRAAGANNYWVRRAGVGARRTDIPPGDPAVPPPPPVADQVASAVVEFQFFIPDIEPVFPAFS